MPKETHVGYVEGSLDALEKVQDVHKRHPSLSVRDICFVLKTSMRTTIIAGGELASLMIERAFHPLHNYCKRQASEVKASYFFMMQGVSAARRRVYHLVSHT